MKGPVVLAAIVLVGAVVIDRLVEPFSTAAWIVIGCGVAFALVVSAGVTIYTRAVSSQGITR